MTITQRVEEHALDLESRWHWREQVERWGPSALAVMGTLVIGVIGIRGADYPAHYARALFWERFGVSMWDNLWYGGHATPTYSVLGPPVMAFVGPFAVVAVGSVLATCCFTFLIRDLLPGRTTSLAAYAFALAMLVNVVVGRAPFAFGLALALVAVVAWRRGHVATAMAIAPFASLVSPVAGVCLAIVAAGVVVAGGRHARNGLLIAAAAFTPIAVVAVLFGSSGWFPFRGGHFLLMLAALGSVAAGVRQRVVRAVAIVAALAAVVVFFVPNPLGGNLVRLGQIVALPLSVAALATVNRRLLVPFAALALAGMVWSIQPGVVAAIDWWGDESVAAAYYRPLVAEVRARNRHDRPIGRLEIPFTQNHWESVYVAPEVPYARGWERQLDLARNEPLYDAALTVEQYHAWLAANGVRWIAVPDVTLDEAGMIEERLIDDTRPSAIPWLRHVWSNDNWRLYEVVDYVPIIDPPAQLTEQGPDWIVIETDRRATVKIRYRYTEYLTISGAACVEPSADGWTIAHLPAPGEYRLTVDPTATWLGTTPDTRCTAPH